MGLSDRTVLAIDGGNSKTDVALVTTDGTVLARARGGASNHQVIGVEAAFDVLRGLVAEVGAATPVDHVHACLAGVDLEEEERELSARLQAEGWGRHAVLANDTFAVLRSGLSDDGVGRGGLAVVCGAGLNCVGVASDGRTTRFLALGEMSGDWGGGGDVGQQAAWSAIRAEDGRGPDTVLRQTVPAHLGLERAVDVAHARYHDKIAYEDLYDLVPLVYDAARDGDDVARALLDRLAEEVCTMLEVAAHRLDLEDSPCQVVLGGGLLTTPDPSLRSRVHAGLTRRIPRASAVLTPVAPIAGAALLGLDAVGADLAALRAARAGFGDPTGH